MYKPLVEFKTPCECATQEKGKAVVIPKDVAAAVERTVIPVLRYPTTYMKKLYLEYPEMTMILQETPPDCLSERVFDEKIMSVYQVEYCHMGVGGVNPCDPLPEKEEPDPCKKEPVYCPEDWRGTKIVAMVEECPTVGGEDAMTFGIKDIQNFTEYQDLYSRVGGEIMRVNDTCVKYARLKKMCQKMKK